MQQQKESTLSEAAARDNARRDFASGRVESFEFPVTPGGLGKLLAGKVAVGIGGSVGWKGFLDGLGNLAGKLSRFGKKPHKDIKDELQEIVNKATKDVDQRGLSALTGPQAKAVEGHPGLSAAYRGQRIDALARKNIKDAFEGRFKGYPNRGPDLIDPQSGRKFDMTTKNAFPDHQRKYGDDLELLDAGTIPDGWGGL
jgi:hypothetical protein